MLAADAGVAVASPAPFAESVTRADCTSIVFIDTSVDDLESLVGGVVDGAEVVLIQSDESGIDQITRELARRRGITSVHLVTHGQAGRLQIGNDILDHGSVEQFQSQLSSWATAMNNGADFLIYGCEVGRGERGSQLMRAIGRMTGTDVAASTNFTGNTNANSDWLLEKQFGHVDAATAFSSLARDSYKGLLPITIRAAGVTGEENMQLRIDGSVVATWNGIGGDAYGGQFNDFSYSADGISADRISIAFTNDLYDDAAGIDRNLRVDYITVDGQIFQTESPAVFSTGTWKPNDGIVPGFRESEYLHTDGTFQFSDPGNPGGGTVVAITASGDTGAEAMTLQIDGADVRTWNATATDAVYTFVAAGTVDADSIRISFDNDVYDPANGIDRNLNVDQISLDGVVYQTEAPTTYSTGTWLPADGITPGFRQSETLHSNGYFQFDGEPIATNPGTIGLAVTQVTVDENGGTAQIALTRTGGSDGVATAFYQTVGIEATDGVDFVGNASGTVVFADGQTTATATIALIDDNLIEPIETFSVSLYRVDGAELGVPRTAIVTIVDDETGTGLVGHWRLNETAIGQTVADSSGNGNSGVHRNIASPDGPTTDAPNTDTANPRSLNFDGVNDFVSVNPNPSLNLSSGSFTQSVWIKSEIIDSAFHGIMGYQSGAAANRYPGIWVYQQTKIHAGFGDGTNWNSFVTGDVLVPGKWNHVATTFDGTTYKAFVNGAEVYSSNQFAGRAPTSLDRMDIGRVDNYFQGSIDDARVYNRALTASEVSVLIDGADLPVPDVQGQLIAQSLVSGFDTPIAVDWLPDGRMLVAEQDGLVRIVNANGTIASTPLLDIRNIVNSGTKDRGMLGFAVHPDFANNPYIYVSYTYDPPEVIGQSGLGGVDGNGARVARISRYTVNAAGTFANPNSGVVLVGENSTYANIGTPNKRPDLGDPHSCFDASGNPIDDCIPSDETSHTIGDLEFGPDGMLYATTGDGGSFGRADPVNLRSLDLDSLAGKLLRIDPITGDGLPDNPFFDGDVTSNASKVYAYGLRNGFRFAIDQTSGEFYVGDVGWTQWEEINTGRGANFGWPAFEGGGNGTSLQTSRYRDLPQVQAYYATNPVVTAPVWARLHSSGARAIVMGDFATSSVYGEYQDTLLFTDIGDQVIRAARFDANGSLLDVEVASAALGFLVDMQMANDGFMYYVDIASGSVGRLEFQTV
ncbi:Quinoprotein glucose dehydrogenase B precursor [Rubripirellula tenax]|uniref:Quinoprotein glucose dehydrogenase B n=2 Tax=Rubripirellula tenax TaxID=2528015 RepID=A0A5C6EJF0_9BACT|nr:Quinoprotein glucose dehydrogenase B precursor [Rubripirellula tenax]